MSVRISPNLPANVVEIGVEISQAKLDAINNGSAPASGNPFVTVSYLTGQLSSYITSSTAASTYQTISGMSSYLTTSSASSTYATKASPTFTGTVTIPAGASISGYLTTSVANSTYQTISGMSSYATQSYVTSQGYLTDAPSNGSEYVRKNGAWSVATGGGGGGSVAWGAITGTVTDQTDLTSYISGLGYQTSSDVSTYVTGLGYITSSGLSVTNIDLTGNFNGYSVGSGNYTFRFDSSTNKLSFHDGYTSILSIGPTGITFPDSSVLSTAPSSGGVISGGFSYTITPADAGKTIVMDNSSGSTNINFSGTFIAGSIFYIVNKGTVYTADISASGGYYLNDTTSGSFSVPTLSVKTLVCTGTVDFWIS